MRTVYTFCAFFSDIDILLYYKRAGVWGSKVKMGVASSEFWDIPTSAIANYCTGKITV
jgi:hypothetical protein